jgi:hypothetical protein
MNNRVGRFGLSDDRGYAAYKHKAECGTPLLQSQLKPPDVRSVSVRKCQSLGDADQNSMCCIATFANDQQSSQNSPTAEGQKQVT